MATELLLWLSVLWHRHRCEIGSREAWHGAIAFGGGRLQCTADVASGRRQLGWGRRSPWEDVKKRIRLEVPCEAARMQRHGNLEMSAPNHHLHGCQMGGRERGCRTAKLWTQSGVAKVNLSKVLGISSVASNERDSPAAMASGRQTPITVLL